MDKAIYAYIRLIVMKSLPTTIVEDQEFRNLSRFNVAITRRTIVSVIFALVELVERRVASELKRTKGAVNYDGWSDTGTHCVAVYASYNMERTEIVNNSTFFRSVPRCALLAVSPMSHVDEKKQNLEQKPCPSMLKFTVSF